MVSGGFCKEAHSLKLSPDEVPFGLEQRLINRGALTQLHWRCYDKIMDDRMMFSRVRPEDAPPTLDELARIRGTRKHIGRASCWNVDPFVKTADRHQRLDITVVERFEQFLPFCT
jgi:hypothetical protein